jgi:hypothetical protein
MATMAQPAFPQSRWNNRAIPNDRIFAMKILYSSGELYDAIKTVLENPQPQDRRVALVAFIGGQAQAFLPDPKGLEIVCWLQPGSTDALTLDRLRKRKATIYKSEGLHMKVYWSSRSGCVISSANASGNALGGGRQKEAGVWFPPDVVDIERLWTYAKPKPIKDSDLKRLTRLSEQAPWHNVRRSQEPPPDFLEWQHVTGRRDWKLGWWDVVAPFANDAVKQAKQSYGVTEPNDFVNVKRGQIHPRDWILLFVLPGGTNVRWMYADFVIKVSPSDKAAFDKDYPFQAVEATPTHPRPPFELDKSFRRAFKKAIKIYGATRIESAASLRPTKSLLDLIAKNMRTVAE